MTHLNDWSNNVDMNTVFSEMSDENTWLHNAGIFVLKGWERTPKSDNKGLWSAKMECFIKIYRNKGNL